ncbi:MAG: ABC transporter substrate-binding protein [Bacteroidetes bacterium MedPE-SWsnd-G2]|nr:MAG: ABC transporter substrate-binding protein [Bacteroidetes bacterium MedPE-SWsnd-G2]
MKFLSLLIIFCCIVSCQEQKTKVENYNSAPSEAVKLKYAKGFSITNYENFTVLEIKSPWPKSESQFRYALQNPNSNINFNLDSINSVIEIPVKEIVVTSTTHIPSLDLLNETESLVGFPGMDYISSPTVRSLIKEGKVRELGKNEGLNTEVLLELQPDLVVGFGVDGSSKSLENIRQANIPVIYNGDWVEKSPLAKAEWIKFFGVLFNKQKQADSIFDAIESNYLKAQKIASSASNRPTVISGAMHKDIWYLPSGTSSEGQFLKDANTNYYWQNTIDQGSLALNFETVFATAKDADIWFSPSYYRTLEDLKIANEHYIKFKALRTNKVYSFTNTTGETGGVLYYELGLTRPDLILKDIVKISHPELLEDYQTVFFKLLE